jgi:hypothetical protein
MLKSHHTRRCYYFFYLFGLYYIILLQQGSFVHNIHMFGKTGASMFAYDVHIAYRLENRKKKQKGRKLKQLVTEKN